LNTFIRLKRLDASIRNAPVNMFFQCMIIKGIPILPLTKNAAAEL